MSSDLRETREINTQETGLPVGYDVYTEPEAPEEIPRPPRKKRRKKMSPVYVALIVIAVCALLGVVMHLDYFNVTGIAVTGNSDIRDRTIIKQSELELGKNIFDVHPFFVQKRILKNLYIEDVNVDRKLPGIVEIHVTEKTGLVQFEQKVGKKVKYIVADQDGLIIETADEEQKATVLEGVKIVPRDAGKKIKAENEEVLDRYMDFVQLTEDNDLYFKRVNISDGKVTAYVYDHLLVKGKYRDVVSCIKEGVLRNVIYELYQDGTEKGTISISDNNYCFFTPKD